MEQPGAAELWRKACSHLQDLLHPDVYSRWIAVIEPKALVDHTLTLRVDNNFYQTWLEDNYLPLIQTAVASVCGDDLTIAFEVKPRAAAAAHSAEAAVRPDKAAKDSAAAAAKLRPKPETLLNPRFTFDDFIVGPSNNFAHAAALAVAQAPARAYNPLFIYGGVGLGKTHLMQAIGHHVLANSHAKVCYLSSEAFTNEYIDNLQNRTLVQFRKRYRTVDLLLIDDIHFLAGKERMQEEFFHTFNALFDAHKQIVMTSDRPASEIHGLEQRLVSRFEWGLVTELQPPDLETRIAILRNKMAKAATPLSDEIIFFLARSIRANIRRLEGALLRVTSYASLTGRPLTLQDAENLLRDTLDQEKQETLTFELIMKAVADYYDVRMADLTSKRRPQAIAMPRQVAMYLCRSLTSASLPEIASAFAKTHATVLHGCRAVEKRMAADQDVRQCVAHLTSQLERRS
jgi:chromosomal replication initiator protein